MAVDQVINMIPMWHRLVSASWPVDMPRLVSATVVLWGTTIRVLVADFDSMLIDMPRMWMMQVAVMKKIDMTVMPDRRVAAVLAVPVVMVDMVRQFASAHA
jgi:hypothetical protein